MSALETAAHGAEVVEHKLEEGSSRFASNARRAIQEAPDYFVWWYTVKSIGLGVAVALAAYYYGKSKGQAQALKSAGRGTYR